MKTEIIYEDRDILVCYKPAGLAVQSANIESMDVVSELKNYLKSSYLGIVHRLDQPVEGMLVFAKNRDSAAILSKQLQQEILNKKYLAAVYGIMEKEKAILENYLMKDSKLKLAKIVEKDKENAKKAILSYEVMVQTENYSILSVEIKTGRFHQIRVQLSHQGNPILGDQKYGKEASRSLSKELHVQNVALCANELVFFHPVTKERLEFCVTPRGEIFQGSVNG